MATILYDIEQRVLNENLISIEFNKPINLIKSYKKTAEKILPQPTSSQVIFVDATNIYKRITDYLIEQGYAFKIHEKIEDSDIFLTRVGMYLVSYGSVEMFEQASNQKSKPSDDILVARVPTLIAELSEYGEFIMVEDEINPTLWEKNKQELCIYFISEHQRRLLDEWTLQYLVKNGFMINRHDIKVVNNVYRQFTDKGRVLWNIPSRSIDDYNEILEKEKSEFLLSQNAHNRETQRNKLQFLVNVLLCVWTFLAAVYYVLEILRIQYHLGLPNHVFFP